MAQEDVTELKDVNDTLRATLKDSKDKIVSSLDDVSKAYTNVQTSLQSQLESALHNPVSRAVPSTVCRELVTLAILIP